VAEAARADGAPAAAYPTSVAREAAGAWRSREPAVAGARRSGEPPAAGAQRDERRWESFFFNVYRWIPKGKISND
jgi:hypothetical protein